MELNYLNQVPLGGFSYDNCVRNTALQAQTKMAPQMKFSKTGTTICGCIFDVSLRNSEYRESTGVAHFLPAFFTAELIFYMYAVAYYRAEWHSLLIPEPLQVRSLLTRTARSSTFWPLTFSALVQELLPIASTSLVSHSSTISSFL